MKVSPFASIAFRQAVGTMIPVLVALAVFAAAAIATVRGAARSDLLHTIDTDIAGLIDVAAQGGSADLARRIGDRTAIASAMRERAVYLLVGPDGQRRAGNLDRAPPIEASRSSSGEVREGGETVLIRATALRGGYRLYVGRSLALADAAVRRLAGRFAVAGLFVVAAALLVAIWTARRLAGRVAALNAVLDRFAAGDLKARPDPILRADEFGILGRHIARLLEASATLVATQRRISDDIAHELRTPLSHLDTRIRLALAGLAADDPLGRELEQARADIRSILSLFDGLLDIALTESTTHRNPERIDLSELVADLAELYAASAEEAGLAFTARIAPGVELFGEPMQISRLVTNLLDNALKFVPAGCAIRLSLSPGPRLVIEDDGPGIPPGDRERIFGRFARAAGREKVGHGLGLALARVIAARHGLVLRVEDARPGARFIAEPREKKG